jgi:hypothetical protein
MPSKPYAIVDTSWPVPDEVRDEEYTIPKGETRYTLRLSDEQMELLARGIVCEEISQRAFRMLGWKRQSNRTLSQALAD